MACNAAFAALCTDRPDEISPGMRRADIVRSAIRRHAPAPLDEETVARRAEAHIARLDAGLSGEITTCDERVVRIVQTRSDTGDRVVVSSDRTVHHRAERLQRRHAEALAAAKQEVERQAREDSLTGLANRRGFEEALSARLAPVTRLAPAAPIARIGGPDHVVLLRADLDNFKYVNDVFGHAAGDGVLCHVARLLEAEIGPREVAARIGGDEFAILLAPGATEARATALAEAVRIRLRAAGPAIGRMPVTASIGIAQGPIGAVDPDEILSYADTALYEAKAHGRDRVECFTPSIHARLLRNRRLAEELRAALENGEIEPFFQPQVSAQGRRLCGAEVLARWRRPDGSLRPPSEFLEIAHQLRLTSDIDAMVFDKATALVAEWAAAGQCPPKLSFNVSSQRMHESGLVEAARRLADCGPKVAFEILESTMIEEESQVFAFHIDALKEAGIGIEIDDFGSGHASLLGVLQAAPDTVKLDRRLVQPLLDSSRLQSMVRALVEIGRTLDIAVTAEGVETPAHADLLTELGCDTLQGYAFAPPLPASEFAALLGAQGAPFGLAPPRALQSTGSRVG